MRESRINQSDLSRALAEITTRLPLIDKLKVRYRPLICPIETILELIPPHQYVFDIGCGSAQFLWLLCRFRDPAKVHGVEISEQLVNNARKLFMEFPTGHPAGFSVYNGVELPASIQEADYVTLIDVWHHIPPSLRDAFLGHLWSGMKPGATLILKDIDGGSAFVYANKIHDLIFSAEVGHESTMAEAASLLSARGLMVQGSTRTRIYVYPHYTLVAIKPAE
jgi:2-polyprenyl-3-methyl-5-hydroxy-6-metoxy-1,4-benzoquinol methylase